MSFNVNNFVGNALKSPVQKIVDGVVGQVTSGLRNSVTSIASSLSESLFNVGQSFESISALSALKVDTIVSGASNDYSGLAGRAVEKASASVIASLRSGGSSTGVYSTQITPQGKIAAASAASQGVDVYPLDIGKYTIRFDFATYRRPAPFSNVEFKTDYSVILPIPGDLKETYSADWAQGELGISGDIGDALTRTPSMNQLGQTGARAGYEALQATKVVPGAVFPILEQYAGLTPNPNISMMFKGPKLRDHIFNWKFSPESPEESTRIKNIIKKMKAKTLAKAGKNHETSFLGYPSMVQVSLSPNKLYDFKICIVESVTANYSINGVPSFFKGTNAPTFINLTINLKEIEYFLSEEEGFDSLDETYADIKNNLTKFAQNATPQTGA